jgi:hypothetical protein
LTADRRPGISPVISCPDSHSFLGLAPSEPPRSASGGVTAECTFRRLLRESQEKTSESPKVGTGGRVGDGFGGAARETRADEWKPVLLEELKMTSVMAVILCREVNRDDDCTPHEENHMRTKIFHGGRTEVRERGDSIRQGVGRCIWDQIAIDAAGRVGGAV